MKDISLVMIVKNEEVLLSRCLASAQELVSEMIIVDTGSSDSTLDVAKKFGAKTFRMQWEDDFSSARNFALSKATCTMVLHLDADEYLSAETRTVIDNADITDGDIFKLDLIEENGEFLAQYPRLFRRSSVAGYKGRIHETLDLLPGARITDLKAAITHSGYSRDEISAKNKAQRNFDLLGLALKDDPTNARTNFLYGRELDRRSSADVEIYYQRALDSGYSSLDLYKFYSTFLAKRGHALKALKIAEQGLGFYPKNDELYYLLGLIYLDLKDHDKAIDVFESCAGERLFMQIGETAADRAQGYSSQRVIPLNLVCRGIGLAYKEKGDIRASVKAFARALAFDPADDLAKQLIFKQLRGGMNDAQIEMFIKSILKEES